jgi:hypothetical protein
MISNFEKSNVTVIRGRYEITTNILYLLCINSVSNNRDAIFIDCSNTFNPYIISRMAKFLGANQKNVLRHIHIARAFTEYQMEALILDLDNIIKQKNPEILAISNLYNNSDNGNNNFEKCIENIKLVTKSLGIITVISTTNAIDSYIESKVDKILNVDNKLNQLQKQLSTKVDNLQLISLDDINIGDINIGDINIGDMMGRTVPSFRYHLDEIISELQIFRRALHGEDKIAFDNLIEKARKHTSSCTIVPTLDPFNCILLSILIEQQKELKTLKELKVSKDAIE